MDDPAQQLTWEIDDSGLDRADVRALRKAIDACAHWLEVWNSFVQASLARPVILVVSLHNGDNTIVTADRDSAHLYITVPKSLPGEADLQYEVLAGALKAVETAAQLFPHSPPPTIWERPTVKEPEEDPGPSAAEWEILEPEEMLLFGSFVGADKDGLSMFQRLDEYVYKRVAGTGIAKVVDTQGGPAGAAWTIAVSHSRT